VFNSANKMHRIPAKNLFRSRADTRNHTRIHPGQFAAEMTIPPVADALTVQGYGQHVTDGDFQLPLWQFFAKHRYDATKTRSNRHVIGSGRLNIKQSYIQLRIVANTISSIVIGFIVSARLPRPAIGLMLKVDFILLGNVGVRYINNRLLGVGIAITQRQCAVSNRD
jgi:hypothetical protein